MGKIRAISTAQFRENRKRSKGKRSFLNGESRGAESLLQEHCVNWFRLHHRSFGMQLFSVPNGGFRTQEAGALMKKEGMLRGVSDLLLLSPGRGYHGLCVEFKIGRNDLSEEQLRFGVAVAEAGYLFRVVRAYDDFRALIAWYLASSTL